MKKIKLLTLLVGLSSIGAGAVMLGSRIASLPTVHAKTSGANANTPPADPLCKQSGQYCVNRETSSGVCHAQEATERPQLGINLKGPFKSRADAVVQMCKLYEPASDDPNKCAEVAPKGICPAK